MHARTALFVIAAAAAAILLGAFGTDGPERVRRADRVPPRAVVGVEGAASEIADTAGVRWWPPPPPHMRQTVPVEPVYVSP